MGKETNGVDLELERLADLLAYLIEKNGDKIEFGMILKYRKHNVQTI